MFWFSEWSDDRQRVLFFFFFLRSYSVIHRTIVARALNSVRFTTKRAKQPNSVCHIILAHTLWCNSYPQKHQRSQHTTNTLQKSNYIDDAYKSVLFNDSEKKKKNKSENIKSRKTGAREECVQENSRDTKQWRSNFVERKKNYFSKKYVRTDVCNMSVSCSVHTDYHLTPFIDAIRCPSERNK